MKKVGLIVLFLLIGLLVLPILVNAKIEKISKNSIEKEFDNGKGFVNVLIEEKNSQNKLSALSIDKEKNKFYSKNITYKEYLELSKDDSLIVEYNFKIKKILQDSTKIIKANDSWSLNSLGLNLTGKGQTVCILDTGINYSHPDFGSCTSINSGGNCRVIGGYDFGNNDADPKDVDGHGTHVAGIVGANGGIKGVAPNVNIVSIKVFDDSGDGTDQKILDGLDWCIDNASLFNITVISMSIGLLDGYGNSIVYNNYCDSDFTLLRNRINAATAKNISVIVASGNDYESGYIGVPACIQNATPVTSTNKEDRNISNFANRWDNSLLRILAAPGENINSTMLLSPHNYPPSYGTDIYDICRTGNYYCSLDGTSMATPHVAGSISIINQYLFSVGQTKTPDQIENLLNSTGKQIYDSAAGRVFSRIDVYSALLEIDSTNPNVTLSTPLNNSVNISSNQTFVCNSSDWQLKNVTLYLWNSSSLNYTETKNISGTTNSTYFNVTGLNSDTYKWNCIISDVKDNNAFATNNFSLIIGGIHLSVIEPQNNTYTNINETYFNCSATTSADRQLKNITFQLYENYNLINNTSVNLTGTTNSTLFNYTFINETNYTWKCEVYSNNSDYESRDYTIFYDITYPIIDTISDSMTTDQATISWNTNEETNYSITLQDTQNSTFSKNHSVILTGLSASTTYNYNLTYCDLAGNCNLSEKTFRTSDVPTSSSSGGGGGGGGGSTPIKLTETQIAQGYSKKYSVGEKVSFVSRGQNHSLQLNKIINNSVNVTLRSEPINLIMQSGEEKKINLTSSEYYDLYIKIENVTKYNANITIKQIEELINPHKLVKYENETLNETENKGKRYDIFDNKEEKSHLDTFSIYVLMFFLLCVFFYFILRKKVPSKKTKKRNKKD